MINFFDIFGPSGATTGGNLTPEANAFVNAISDNESAGAWDVIYGGQKFTDFSKHPAVFVTIKAGPNKGKLSSAAGKFQITKTTYDRVAPILGITDFTPESQKRIAWYLAQEKVPNLQKVLETGDTKKIQAAAKAVNGVWTSLPGGIEATQTSKGFSTAYDKYIKTGESMVPPAGMPSDLDMDVLSYVDYGRGPLAGRLPTDLKRMSEDAIKRHDSVVKTVSDLMKNGIVVPSGTRDLKNTAAQVIDFPAADLIAAGVNSMGMSSIPADPKGPLPKPSPLAPWGNRPVAAGKVVAPGVIDVGGAPDSSSLKGGAPTSLGSTFAGIDWPPKEAAKPMSKNPANVSGAPVAKPANKSSGNPANTVGAPLSPKVNPKPAPVAAPPMSVNDQKLAQLVKTMTAKTPPSIEKTTGLAGSAELPRDYKPPAGIIPGTTAKPAAPKQSQNPANTTGTPVAKPASKTTTVPNPIAVATGAKTNAPVSLSNPVLQPVKTTPKAAPVTQTVSKPMPPGLMDAVGKVLLEPKPATQPKGVVEAKPKSTAVPAWGATVPALGAKPVAPAAKPATPAPAAKPATVKVSAPIKKVGLLESGSVLKKTLEAAPAGKVAQTDLKDLNPDGTKAKVGGAVTKTKDIMSPLDLLGDIFLNGGAKTVGLIGGALAGSQPRDIGQAQRAQTLKDMASGKPTTVINQIKATTGMSSAQAYDYAVSQNNSKSGTTSSGAPKTKSDGSSWAA